MVQKIKYLNHVIRLFEMAPSTSWAIPESCPSCGVFYNDGSHRKCYYLCCEYIDCLDCVINQNKFSCPVFDDYLTVYMKRKRKLEKRAKLLSSSSRVTTESMIAEENFMIGTNTASSTFFNEADDGVEPSNNKDDYNINMVTEEVLDSNNNETGKENETFDKKARENEMEIERTEELNDCDVVKTLKSQVELLLPKHHLNPVVVLKRVTGVNNNGINKRRKKYRKRFDPTLPPSRKSGRLRSAKNSEMEVVMPA